MNDKAIIFSAPMVRAILAGRKTQTRRVVKMDPTRGYVKNVRGYDLWHYSDPEAVRACPFGPIGRHLWVRETWAPCIGGACAPGNPTLYRADDEPVYNELTWCSPIYMPRWASRITLEVTEIRLQRLNEISEQDAVAEGFAAHPYYMADGSKDEMMSFAAVDDFATFWANMHGEESLRANPWVWAVTFKQVETNHA